MSVGPVSGQPRGATDSRAPGSPAAPAASANGRTVSDPTPRISMLMLQRLAAETEAQALLDLLPPLTGLQASVADDRRGQLALAANADARAAPPYERAARLSEGLARLIAWLPEGVRLSFVERPAARSDSLAREVVLVRRDGVLFERAAQASDAPDVWSAVAPQDVLARLQAGVLEEISAGTFLTSLRVGAARAAADAPPLRPQAWTPLRAGLLAVGVLLILAAVLFARH